MDIQSLSQAEWTDALGFCFRGRSDKSEDGETMQTSWTYSQAEWTDAVGFGCRGRSDKSADGKTK